MDPLTMMQRVVTNDPDDPFARLQLADALEESGYDGARHRRIAAVLGKRFVVSPKATGWIDLIAARTGWNMLNSLGVVPLSRVPSRDGMATRLLHVSETDFSWMLGVEKDGHFTLKSSRQVLVGFSVSALSVVKGVGYYREMTVFVHPDGPLEKWIGGYDIGHPTPAKA